MDERKTMKDKKFAVSIGKIVKQLEEHEFELKRSDVLYGITFVQNGEWEIHIENHTDDPDYHDWLIYICEKDESNVDWYGQKYDAGGCISFEVMKLITELVDLLKSVDNKEKDDE